MTINEAAKIQLRPFDEEPTKIEQAVEILNREKLYEAADWRVIKVPGWEAYVNSSSVPIRLSQMSAFSAIAIAEKCEREKPAPVAPPKSKAEEVAGKIWEKTVGAGKTHFTGAEFARMLRSIGEKKGSEDETKPI